MKIFKVALGILAAIGGFVDIGDLVFNVAAGATFGYQLLWVVVIGVVGIIVYSEMCGRVAAVSGKAVFDAVRERVGFKAGLAALVSAQVVNLLTLTAEIGGVAICLELLSGLPYRWLIVLAGLALMIVVWVVAFEWIERVFGYGIAMRTRSFLPGVKWLFIRSWDKALFRLEDRNVAIRAGNCSRKPPERDTGLHAVGPR